MPVMASVQPQMATGQPPWSAIVGEHVPVASVAACGGGVGRRVVVGIGPVDDRRRFVTDRGR
jgi:hypothetical protein